MSPHHPRPSLRKHEQAVNAVLPFVVAVGLFAGALAGILAFSSDRIGNDDEAPHQRTQKVEAESLADVLVTSPGIGWEDGPDALDRLGFMRADGRGIDLARLDALRNGSLVADPTNGKVDYEEALASLGFPTDGTRGIHISINVRGLSKDAYALDPATVRAAYVGDWPNLDPVLVSLGTEEEMAEAARAELDAMPDARVLLERARLPAVGLDFDDAVHITGDLDVDVDVLGVGVPIGDLVPRSTLDGDVFPDHAAYIADVLPDALDDYDLLVVGSEVDHSTLQPNNVKSAIADWVVGGGVLMVMGSDQQSGSWLNDLFQEAEPTVNQQPVVPDTQNRVLSEPNDLDWETFDDHEQGWDVDQGGEPDPEDFTRVLINGGLDVLSISGDGVYGDGYLMLTSFRPGEIAETDPAQAEAFFDNLLHYGLGRQLSLEFGPTPPQSVSTGSAVRSSQAWDDRAGLVPLEIRVIVW